MDFKSRLKMLVLKLIRYRVNAIQRDDDTALNKKFISKTKMCSNTLSSLYYKFKLKNFAPDN